MRTAKIEDSTRKYVLWGGTGQAKVLREIMTDLELVAVFDNNPDVPSPFEDIPLYSGMKEFQVWLQSQPNKNEIGFLVAIGGDRGVDRLAIHDNLESVGLRPLIAKHSSAVIAAGVKIGSGSHILAGAVICVDAVIGRSCIVNTSASVDHESILGDGVHVCPGARLAGLVKVEQFATIYSGAVVIPRITIGEGAVVAAGAVVINDVPSYTMVAGNPAKIIRKLEIRRYK
ncbi:MAG: NeuD/PglB/VioB family sugar acetyltransferase [Anaerolineales bacterium]